MGVKWKDIVKKDKEERNRRKRNSSFEGSRDKQRKMLHNVYLSSRIQHSPCIFLSSSPPMSKYPLSPSSKYCGLFWGQFF